MKVFDSSQIVFAFVIGVGVGVIITYMTMSSLWLMHIAKSLKANEQVAGTWLPKIFTRLDERRIEREANTLKHRMLQITDIAKGENDG